MPGVISEQDFFCLTFAIVSCETPATRAISLRVSKGATFAEFCKPRFVLAAPARPPALSFSFAFLANSGSSFSANSAREKSERLRRPNWLRMTHLRSGDNLSRDKIMCRRFFFPINTLAC